VLPSPPILTLLVIFVENLNMIFTFSLCVPFSAVGLLPTLPTSQWKLREFKIPYDEGSDYGPL
jgi:hypothetical protein